MADRGIIFTAPMVRALLDGRKTQTRRLLNPQPADTSANGKNVVQVADYCTGAPEHGKAYYWRVNGCWNSSDPFKLPHAVGDRLYVRETWRPHYLGDGIWDIDVSYPADGSRRTVKDGEFGEGDWLWPKAADGGDVPSIHMPRWASRLTLTVTDVRVQRLQAITDEDARAEGCSGCLGPNPDFPDEWDPTPREEFEQLWNSLHNKPGTTWADNPWIYAVTFEVMRVNIDSITQAAQDPPPHDQFRPA